MSRIALRIADDTRVAPVDTADPAVLLSVLAAVKSGDVEMQRVIGAVADDDLSKKVSEGKLGQAAAVTIEVGADAYVPKPIDTAALIKAIGLRLRVAAA